MMLYFVAFIALVGAAGEHECNTKYRCYAPLNTANKCDSNGKLTQVTNDVEPGCILLMKLHPYTNNWYRIILESGENTKNVEIKYKDRDDKEHSVKCMKDGDKVKASYDTTVVKKIIGSVIGKFKCEFEVDMRLTVKANLNDELCLRDVNAAVTANNVTTTTTAASQFPTPFCSPLALRMSHDSFEPYKYYGKAKYESGRVECNSSMYTGEYRAEGSDSFQPFQEMYCKGMGEYIVKINNQEYSVPKTDEADVRCATDAKTFCGYNLKIANRSMGLVSEDGKMMCPPEYFFEIRGQIGPTKDAVIKCQNHNGIMKWTYKTTNKTIILSKNGPEVHCRHTWECYEKNKIPPESLKRSFLNDKFLPTCQEGGTLNVTDVNVASVSASVTCDKTSGDYRYSYHDETTKKDIERTVTSTTVFWCIYVDEGAAKNAQTKYNIILTSASVGGGAILLAIVIVLAGVYWNHIKEKKRQARFNKHFKHEAEKSGIDQVDDEQDAQAPLVVDKNDEADFNAYLQKKRASAKAAVVCSVLEGKIPSLIRKQEGISPALDQLDGKRPGGITTFVNHKMKTNKLMQDIIKIAQMRRKTIKSLIPLMRKKDAEEKVAK